jgi:RNA polymerase sigma-70 factor (ECF subfamily)
MSAKEHITWRICLIIKYMSDDRHNNPDEDAVLVASWRRGELASFEALVSKYQKRMLNIAFRITGDYEDACEVAQDAFVAAYRGIDAFRGAARFSTWLTSITLNLSRNRLQQVLTKRRNEAYSLDAPDYGEDFSPVHERPSSAPSALEQLEMRSLHAKLKECINSLSVDFRETIVLRDMQDYSYDEMCAILNVREGTVKSRLFRAREMVKECMKRALGEL